MTVFQSPAEKLPAAIRRRVWRRLFERPQKDLGAFFLDPRDHIGRERLIMGDRYEAVYLTAIGKLCLALKLGGGLALDVGANIGNHACWLVGRFSHVVCIEPGEIASRVLEANLLSTQARNWEVVKAALGETHGRGWLERVSQDNLGSNRVSTAGEGSGDVSVRPGGEVLAACAHPELPLEFIKIDVEGAELLVLKGLAQAIQKGQPLICVEALDGRLWAEIRDFLRSLGYTRFLAHRAKSQSFNLFHRLWALLAGERWTLVPLPPRFPDGGYGMVYCLTADQAKQLGISELAEES